MKTSKPVAGLLFGAVLLALAGPAFAEPPKTDRPAETCTCAAAFDRAVTKVEADYAGFLTKVGAERQGVYDRLKSLLKADAAGADPDRCARVLDAYVTFFQDHHLVVLRGKAADGPRGGKTARAWTEAEARSEIERNRHRLDPVEGLWYSRGGRLAVLREEGGTGGTFFAVRLAAGGAPSNELAAVFRRTPRGGYEVTRRDAEGRWQTGEASLHRGGSLLVSGIASWGRLLPEVKEARLDPVDPQAPLFARLDADTVYLSLPSFLGEYRQPLNDLIAARGEEIAKARGLVIDVRGNVGGDAIYFGLATYLLTGPIQFWEDNMIRSSEGNIRYLQSFRDRLGEDGKVFDPALQRMRENPGKLVPYLDGQMLEPPSVSPGPRGVAVLTDRAVGSAAEAFVYHARQSPRVTVVGENTRGNIDYQQVVSESVGCGDYAYLIGVPLYMRTRTLPAGALDGIGFAPDVPVKDPVTDPLAFAVRLLASGNP